MFFFDDIVERPRETFEDIVRFIGADIRKRFPLVPVWYNRKEGNAKPCVSAEARAWVAAAFQDELRSCSERFGERGRQWLDRNPSGDFNERKRPESVAICSEV